MYWKRFLQAVVIAVVGVFGVDYFSHFYFSDPMETPPYFLTKLTLYIVFSFLFLTFLKFERYEVRKVWIGGITVSLIWGTYYNILPAIFDYYPFGIPLEGLTFLGMGLIGTGFAFGAVHTLAFVVGYYANKLIFGRSARPIPPVQ